MPYEAAARPGTRRAVMGATSSGRPDESVYAVETDLPFRGVRQLWWPTLSAFERSAEAHHESLSRLLRQAGKSTTILTTSERWLR